MPCKVFPFAGAVHVTVAAIDQLPLPARGSIKVAWSLPNGTQREMNVIRISAHRPKLRLCLACVELNNGKTLTQTARAGNSRT